MDYELAVLEQRIKEQRQRVAAAACSDESEEAENILSFERQILDDLYKTRIVLSDKKEFEAKVSKLKPCRLFNQQGS